jgi:hypothetical protein
MLLPYSKKLLESIQHVVKLFVYCAFLQSSVLVDL